jgi:hypothetical protein
VADLDVGLYLYAQFLEVLYYRTIDCTAKIGMLIRNDTGFVADAIIDILQGCVRVSKTMIRREGQRSTHLKAALTEELIGGAKRYLNDSGEFCHLFCSVILDVGYTLEKRVMNCKERSR